MEYLIQVLNEIGRWEECGDSSREVTDQGLKEIKSLVQEYELAFPTSSFRIVQLAVVK